MIDVGRYRGFSTSNRKVSGQDFGPGVVVLHVVMTHRIERSRKLDRSAAPGAGKDR